MYSRDLLDAISERGGVIRTRALRALGATTADVRRACRSGDVVRLREGVLALAQADPIVVAAASHGGELACVSMLRHAGIWVFDPLHLARPSHALHVWVGGSGRRHPHDHCACVTHNDAGIAGFGRCSLVIALAQVARCQGAECFFVAFESAWRLGLLTRRMRAEIRSGLPASMLARRHRSVGCRQRSRVALAPSAAPPRNHLAGPGVDSGDRGTCGLRARRSADPRDGRA